MTILYNSGEKKLYKLTTFKRSNGDEIVHQVPLVSHGQELKKGDVLCDGHACQQ
ncbi:hypothetical protein HOG21_04890 [bacterium]|nr:hypothetical protein [bacterium]